MTFVVTTSRQELTVILRVAKQNHRFEATLFRFRLETDLEIFGTSRRPMVLVTSRSLSSSSSGNAESFVRRFRARSGDPLVFSAKRKRRKEYAVAYMCQVSQWVGWHTKLDRTAITRDHRRRPAVLVQFASYDRRRTYLCWFSGSTRRVLTTLGHTYYIVVSR